MKSLFSIYVVLKLFSCIQKPNDVAYEMILADSLLQSKNAHKISTDYNTITYISNPQVSAYEELICGESGDYCNKHTQYYDSNKHLIAYKRSSRFFNSGCSDNVVTEISSYFVKKGRLILFDYRLFDVDEHPLDSCLCEFNYRFPYHLTQNFDELNLK